MMYLNLNATSLKLWPHSERVKGQLISKENVSVFNSPKKTNLKILIFALAKDSYKNGRNTPPHTDPKSETSRDIKKSF